jgi:predicted RNA methylase
MSKHISKMKHNDETFFEDSAKSVSQVANELQVSVSTVRNWIKTGLLAVDENDKITIESLNGFLQHSVGKSKLTSRANKLLKNAHNHKEISRNIKLEISVIKNADELSHKYESALSESYKNKEGIYYTPDYIVIDMMRDFDKNLSDKTFLDPCCGSGNFILEAIRKGFKPENVYGFDIDPNAVEITKKRIFDQTGYVSNNIRVANFLEIANQENRGFYYIFTNPPWGKKILKTDKEKYSKIFQSGKSTDTASLFFFASLHILNPEGKLGFLLPDSFFTISTFEDARIKALRYQIDRLIDYKKAFKGLMTKAQGILLSNKCVSENHNVNCESSAGRFARSQQSFLSNPKSILNFSTTADEAKVIDKVYSEPHITLKKNAVFGLGIVTGDNNSFCKTIPEKGFVPVFRGCDITKNGLKEPTFFIAESLENFQQTAPEHLYKSKEKLIYKFISNELCFYYDTNQRYILNSANFLVLNNDFPVQAEQLVRLFNSDFMTWLFRKIFATHKVLKSDLQHLPIHLEYFEKYRNFTEEKYLDFLQIKKSNQTYILKT